MPNTVWILGAGFARSLGAPLLADLFRQEEPNDLAAFFPEETFPGLVRDMMATQIAFNWGMTVERLWADAEQFLAFLDDVQLEEAREKRERLRQLTMRARRKIQPFDGYYAPNQDGADDMMASGLHRASSRALAAETSRFMMSPRDGELWFPYREWAKSLEGGRDTIVTFNYDVLLDELVSEAPFSIPLPGESAAEKSIPVLKLHGSVNWIAEGPGLVRMGDYQALARPSGAYPAIAAPGRSKSPLGQPPFPQLWDLAEKAIEQAQWVIFMGYRFPPTDALARVRLGRALAKRNGHSVRRIDTVLGPDVESNDSRRLSTLLTAARGDRWLRDDGPLDNVHPDVRYLQIHKQPLWAEDFLTTYQDLARGQRWGPTG